MAPGRHRLDRSFAHGSPGGYVPDFCPTFQFSRFRTHTVLNLPPNTADSLCMTTYTPQNGGTAAQQQAQAYLKTRVLTASPEELRMMLLEGACKFARQARESLGKKDFEGLFNGTTNCRNIVFELMTTIRDEVDPEIASNVRSLYAFIYRLLTDASYEKDAVKYDKAIELLDYERETWALLLKQTAAERNGAMPAAALPEGVSSRPAVGSRAPISMQA